jgi:hypothetical protein
MGQPWKDRILKMDIQMIWSWTLLGPKLERQKCFMPAISQPKMKRSLPTHPLCGADCATLWRLLTRSGGFKRERIGDLATMMATSLLRWPFDCLEKAWVRIQPDSNPEGAPPVFILGHWRSGTTHLYNLLSRAPRFGYLPPIATGLPWNMLTLGKWLEPLLIRSLPSERFIDNVAVKPDSPQEDEIALANMMDISFYHGLYFPKRFFEHFKQGLFLEEGHPEVINRWKQTFGYFMKKLSLLNQGRPLLVKNPVYTARLGLLLEMYPKARFIHIHRNPYRVYQSMKNFYLNLFRELSLQDYEQLSLDKLVLEPYPLIMDRLIQDSKEVPAKQWLELSYESLDLRPMEVLRQAYQHLELGPFNQDRPFFEHYLRSIKTYKKNAFSYPQESVDKVDRFWGTYVNRWGYRSPNTLC